MQDVHYQQTGQRKNINNIESTTDLWFVKHSPNSYIEVLTPSVAVFADGASEKVIKDKQGHGVTLTS